MSFILDALKKSETERQQQAGAEFATVPTSARTPRRSIWPWLLALLLAVNLAVLLGILLRPAKEMPAALPATTAPVQDPRPAADTASRTTADFAAQIASARETLRGEPSAGEAPAETESPPAAAAPVPTTTSIVPRAAPPGRIPTIDELRLEGFIDLPDLRIDIHVYSDDPADRFVFINMNKQREQSLLPTGPLLREIRPDGVVLEYRGRIFLLPRE